MGLRAHWLQHVPFEGLGSIEDWLAGRSARVDSTRFFDQGRLPAADDFDLLIVMGGPMSANDEAAHPWISDEKRLIARAIDSGRAVLGVCLGAQLIASALGARVYRNPEPEIGWFPIERIDGGAPGSITRAIPRAFEAFHWHGETFDLPPGALHLARSRACENQAFTLGERVMALQFHLETTARSGHALVECCRADLVPGPFVQPEGVILGTPERFARANAIMRTVLDSLVAGL